MIFFIFACIFLVISFLSINDGVFFGVLSLIFIVFSAKFEDKVNYKIKVVIFILSIIAIIFSIVIIILLLPKSEIFNISSLF